MGPEVQILSGTPANNAESLCFPGLSAFFIGKHEKALSQSCTAANHARAAICRFRVTKRRRIATALQCVKKHRLCSIENVGANIVRPPTWRSNVFSGRFLTRQTGTGEHCSPLHGFKGSPSRGAPAQRVRGGREGTTPPPIKTTKRKTEECLRHSSIFLFIFCAAHSDRIGCNRATNLRKLIAQNTQKRQKMCKTAGIKKKCTTFNTKNVVANLLNSTLRPFTQ